MWFLFCVNILPFMKCVIESFSFKLVLQSVQVGHFVEFFFLYLWTLLSRHLIVPSANTSCKCHFENALYLINSHAPECCALHFLESGGHPSGCFRATLRTRLSFTENKDRNSWYIYWSSSFIVVFTHRQLQWKCHVSQWLCCRAAKTTSPFHTTVGRMSNKKEKATCQC